MREYKPKLRMMWDTIVIGLAIAIFFIFFNPTILEQEESGKESTADSIMGLLDSVMVYVPYLLVAYIIYKIIYVLRLNYTIDDKGNIVKTKGVIGRFRQDIPYKRITNIHKNRNWLDRILRLTDIEILTAGSSDIEMTFAGLGYDDGEEIYEQLKKFKGIRGDGT